MSQPFDFQSIILTLQRYWADQGCLIWQPYYTQVGAGTMNPATYLRVLGPEPWNVAYVEPSVRPDDGRYGENPNRLQQHYQFQVILKPDPGDPQERYLRSLQALGIDPRQHDIRFVEDNWESPALGAWGLGWEVWLDGQEITQFTYFQQAGGMVLEPVSVEITYGLERIAMALQGVRHFRNLRWTQERTYGDVNLQAEQEHSQYYFEVADVERLRKMFSLFEAEAESSLARGLVLPAHDYILKCSHTFNILDTRGAVGVTERQALFGRMRDLSRRTAEAYVAQREALGFPWLSAKTSQSPQTETLPAETAAAKATSPAAAGEAELLVLEIGVEELPVADLDAAISQLRERAENMLAELRLEHGKLQVLGTPRRLVLVVEDLSARQADRTVVVKGPPANRAFDADGQPTKAAEGFARGRGISAADLQVREMDGGQYAIAEIHEAGRSAPDVLAEALPGLLAGLKFDKVMRWNATGTAFSRPIRWLLALLGKQVVPFTYAGLQADRITRGLRFGDRETASLAQASQYFDTLAAQGIILDPSARRAVIAAQVARLQREVGGAETVDEALLDEVTNLVESPTALRGSFDEEHLELPAPVLISVMKKHQRYFPVFTADGRLMPYFIAVRNGGAEYLDLVADGNEQVIRARFADAAFFIKEDLQHSLEDMLPKLSTLTFQVKLGSMLDKSQRIERLVEKLIPFFGLDDAQAQAARRSAHLAKADLVTNMVVEMTSLQGVMGQYYALKSGETAEVAQAIYEHYLPRFAGDTLPESQAGLVLSIADRLDTLAGLFSVGLAPSGTKDPFAQRRAALGLALTLGLCDLDFDLREGLRMAAGELPAPASAEMLAACLDFVTGRLRSYLMEREEGFRYDVVEAVLAEQAQNPAGALRGVTALTKWVNRPEWPVILPAYARCVRITRDQKETYTIDPSALADPAEQQFYQALVQAEAAARSIGSVDDFLAAFQPMIPAINRFFEAVMVMSDNPAERANRLGLLQRAAALAKGTADLSKLEGF